MWVPRSPDPSEAEMFYTVEVHNKDGKDAPETEYGQNVNTTGSVLKEFLQPGETMKEDMILGRLFDLSIAGVYEVQLSRRIPDDPDGGTVKSNKITIAVTP
jgi:hypothetical protein